jgi:hypothetical protein
LVRLTAVDEETVALSAVSPKPQARQKGNRARGRSPGRPRLAAGSG